MLGLQGGEARKWERLKESLQSVGLSFIGEGDELVWGKRCYEGSTQVNDIYMHLIMEQITNVSLSPFHIAWHLNIPTKILLFD